MMDIRKVFPAVLLAILLLVPTGALDAQAGERAQEQPQQQVEGDLAMLYIVEVEPAELGSFEEALSQHARWRMDEGDPWTWEVYQVQAGEKLGRYYIRAPNLTFEDMDRYEQEFEMRAVEHFTLNVGPHVKTVGSMVTRMDQEAMNMPADPGAMDLLAVSIFELDPAEVSAFQAAVNEAQDLYARAGSRTFFTIHSAVVGTARPQVHVVTLHDGWAGLGTEGPPVAQQQQLVEEEVAEVGEGIAVHEHFKERFPATESVIVRFRADLSVMR